MSWSLSSLGTYEKCGFKYKLKYIERLEEKRSESASRGVDKHKIVEEFLLGNISELPPELNFYTQFLTGLKQHEIYPEWKVSLNRQWEPVEWGSTEVWYKGVLDLKLLQSKEEATIYDWKTGKVYPDHDQQKAIYSIATFASHPDLFSVRAVHVYLDLGNHREKTFHRDQMQQLRKSWEDRVAKCEQDTDFIPNPGWHCRWCSFSRINGGPCRF